MIILPAHSLDDGYVYSIHYQGLWECEMNGILASFTTNANKEDFSSLCGAISLEPLKKGWFIFNGF